MTDYADDNRVYIAPAITWRPRESTFLTLLASYQKNKTAFISGLPVEGTLREKSHGKIPRNRFVGEPGFDKYESDIKTVNWKLRRRKENTFCFYSVNPATIFTA